MGHALARELEDLGRHAASFAALKRGADARRRRLQYRVEDDLDTMRLIADTFVTDFFAAPHAGHADDRPLFVIGLPRSGTTLVDRSEGRRVGNECVQTFNFRWSPERLTKKQHKL